MSLASDVGSPLDKLEARQYFVAANQKERKEKREGTIVSEALAKKKAQETAREEDLALVERIQNGELEAYKTLVERYQKRILSVAFGVLGNYEDAEDVAQDALIKAYKSISKFRGQSSFYTWVYRIAINLCIDLKRKRYRHVETGIAEEEVIDAIRGAEGDAYMGKISGPEERFKQDELRKKLLHALSTLSDEHRTVIVLREIDGLSYEEMSESIQCSKGTVMSRLFHARKKLQALLVDYV